MITLHKLIGMLLAACWVLAAIAILPLAIWGTVTFSTDIFFLAWICALTLLAVPAVNNLMKVRRTVKGGRAW